MNLTISTVATGMMNVSAAEEYSSEAAVETYAEESAQTYAEDTVAPEQVISETDAAYYSSDIGSEVTDTAVVSAETDTTASTVSADIETTAVPVPGGENQTEMPILQRKHRPRYQRFQALRSRRQRKLPIVH